MNNHVIGKPQMWRPAHNCLKCRTYLPFQGCVLMIVSIIGDRALLDFSGVFVQFQINNRLDVDCLLCNSIIAVEFRNVIKKCAY
jgi:hypothetical protein